METLSVSQKRRDEMVKLLAKRGRVTAEFASTQFNPLRSQQEVLEELSALESAGKIRRCRSQVGSNLRPEQIAYELNW